MINSILKNLEYIVIKWYALLHLQQQRVLKLYKDGGITRNIANKELLHIYNLMKLSKKIDNLIMFMLIKIQSKSLKS